ncbi:amidase [Paracoccus pantotrophus]|uniref:amidase n=1 Tax=Paracoccus pantotrophus TaxID=82367 RepID=UPI0018CBF62C|nr:amidase [Paracoccus pantotrophus]
MEAAISVAEQRNPKLNALCCTRFDAAMELARKADLKGRFGALPFLLKDSGLSATFLESTIGSRLFRGMTSAAEATLNTRFMADGFLSFGRTTVPEFCMAPTTEAVVYGGPTRNPWDASRSSGGSSGGAAAAVAAGIVPIAHGSDGGGSIRIPSSCCGVYGLKPSRGLVPYGPARGEGWGGLAVDGVITRTVRDSAAALDGIAGMELGQPYAAPPRPESYLALLDRPFDRPLRIAVWTEAWEDIEIAPECLDAVRKTAGLLAGLGHEVSEAPLPALKYSSFVNAIIDVMSASVTLTVNGYIRQKPVDDLASLLEPAIFDAYQRGKTMSAETYALAINRFHSIARLLETYMLDYDFVLTPTLTQLPAKLGSLTMQDDFKSFRTAAGRYTTFLAIINASGQPAASLPLHQTKAGLPVGVQLIGRFGAEAALLQVSAQLEAAAPWIGRRPTAF